MILFFKDLKGFLFATLHSADASDPWHHFGWGLERY